MNDPDIFEEIRFTLNADQPPGPQIVGKILPQIVRLLSDGSDVRIREIVIIFERQI